jgi:hypothetical protein
MSKNKKIKKNNRIFPSYERVLLKQGLPWINNHYDHYDHYVKIKNKK